MVREQPPILHTTRLTTENSTSRGKTLEEHFKVVSSEDYPPFESLSFLPLDRAALAGGTGSKDRMTDQTRQTPASTRIFPGWHWAALVLAIPIAGYIGWGVSGHVDAPLAALIGGLITGAGIGAAQWFAAKDAFGDGRAWIAISAVAYGAGLVVAAAAVGYNTDVGSLIAMGAISGLFLGVGQGLVLAQQGRRRLALAWTVAMPILLALGWAASTLIGVDVDNQFTVFGASGAIVFTLLSGLLLARLAPRVASAA